MTVDTKASAHRPTTCTSHAGLSEQDAPDPSAKACSGSFGATGKERVTIHRSAAAAPEVDREAFKRLPSKLVLLLLLLSVAVVAVVAVVVVVVVGGTLFPSCNASKLNKLAPALVFFFHFKKEEEAKEMSHNLHTNTQRERKNHKRAKTGAQDTERDNHWHTRTHAP